MDWRLAERTGKRRICFRNHAGRGVRKRGERTVPCRATRPDFRVARARAGRKNGEESQKCRKGRPRTRGGAHGSMSSRTARFPRGEGARWPKKLRRIAEMPEEASANAGAHGSMSSRTARFPRGGMRAVREDGIFPFSRERPEQQRPASRDGFAAAGPSAKGIFLSCEDRLHAFPRAPQSAGIAGKTGFLAARRRRCGKGAFARAYIPTDQCSEERLWQNVR